MNKIDLPSVGIRWNFVVVVAVVDGSVYHHGVVVEEV